MRATLKSEGPLSCGVGVTKEELQETFLHASVYCRLSCGGGRFPHGSRGGRRRLAERADGVLVPGPVLVQLGQALCERLGG